MPEWTAAGLARRGDEIVIAGQYIHTGARVVLWTDEGGYNAYRTERRFVDAGEESWEATQAAGALGRAVPATPLRYGTRAAIPLPGTAEPARERAALRSCVDQFVIHYDVAGTSRACFRTLHDVRGLSVHFMLDVDGTIYQTLDIKEKAWHATIANDRSVGIEIANIGAYPDAEAAPLVRWYEAAGENVQVEAGTGKAEWRGDRGNQDVGAHGSPRSFTTSITSQAARLRAPLHGWAALAVRDPAFNPLAAQPFAVRGEVQGQSLAMYDLTCAQYDALIHLTAALCTALPNIACDGPRGNDGRVLTRVLSPEEFAAYRGILGHCHVQRNKIDPGPAFQWEWVIQAARTLMQDQARTTDQDSGGLSVQAVQSSGLNQ